MTVTSETEQPSAEISTFRSFVVPKYVDVRPQLYVPRNEIPPALLAAEADTMGWDTVNAIRLPVVNATMKASDLYPKTFTYELTPTGSGFIAEGQFDAWYLVQGGSGSIVNMRTPLKQASMKMGPMGNDFTFTDGWASIWIKLEYLPQPPTAAGEPQDLLADPEPRSADDPAVGINGICYGEFEGEDLQRDLFKSALGRWFNANLDQFTYVFTVVNLNARAATGDFQWLKPTYTSYAYANGATEEGSYFGVLNMVENNTAEGLFQQLPPSAIPQGGNASVLISNHMFLKKMVLVGLHKGFEYASEGDFKIAGNDTQIESINTIRMEDIKIDGLDYTPYLEMFRFQVIGDEIQIQSRVRTDMMGGGIHVYVLSTAYYSLKLVNRPDGTQTLDYVESRPMQVDDWHEKEPWIEITSAILGIIGAIVAGVSGTVVRTVVKKVVAIVVITIVAGIAAAIPSLIAQVMAGNAASALPSINDLVTEATGEVEWPESSGLKLKSAELNGSLQLGGDLKR